MFEKWNEQIKTYMLAGLLYISVQQKQTEETQM